MINSDKDKNKDINLKGQVEAVIFASPSPISEDEIFHVLKDEPGEPSLSDVKCSVGQLSKEYKEKSQGIILEHFPNNTLQFRTNPKLSSILERMFATRPRPLSRAAQETLAIIAYRQPVTRVDIEFIRGVDAGSIIKNLLERELIRCVGRKDEVGRPMLFGTSDEFLRVYKLNSIKDLHPLDSFQPCQSSVENAFEKIKDIENKKIQLDEMLNFGQELEKTDLDQKNLSEN